MHVFRLWEEAWVSGRTCNSTQKGPDLLAMRKQCSPPHQRAVCSLMICSKWYNSAVMYLQTATFLPTKQSYCFHYADDAGLHHHFLHLLSSLWGMTSNAPSHLLLHVHTRVLQKLYSCIPVIYPPHSLPLPRASCLCVHQWQQRRENRYVGWQR